jgi:uncharacterized membrane protein
MTTFQRAGAHSLKFDDRRMEIAMGRLLQVGVLLASFVVLVGGVLYVRAHHATAPNYRVFSSAPADLRSLRGLGHGIAAADPAAIIQLGVLLLIATPVARVVFALVAFAIERDKLYVAVSLTVLAVLIFGFFRSQ